MAIRAQLGRLDPSARYVVDRYFFDNLSQIQIAEKLGTSQMSVSRLLSRSLAQLRTWLSDGLAAHEPDATTGPGRPCARLSETGDGHLIVTFAETPDEAAVSDLRDVLVDLAITRRPRSLVADLRHVRQAPATIARALLDAYRACGHTGSRFAVVNVSPVLYATLCRLSMPHMFACHARIPLPTPAHTRPGRRRTPARTPSAPHPDTNGQRRPALVAGPSGTRPHSVRTPGTVGSPVASGSGRRTRHNRPRARTPTSRLGLGVIATWAGRAAADRCLHAGRHVRATPGRRMRRPPRSRPPPRRQDAHGLHVWPAANAANLGADVGLPGYGAALRRDGRC
jgi:anti-anti-sigma regulatory factor